MPSNSSAFAIGIGIGVSVLAYIYTKAFIHSPKPTRQQIVENGGSVCQANDGSLLEYFQSGTKNLLLSLSASTGPRLLETYFRFYTIGR